MLQFFYFGKKQNKVNPEPVYNNEIFARVQKIWQLGDESYHKNEYDNAYKYFQLVEKTLKNDGIRFSIASLNNMSCIVFYMNQGDNYRILIIIDGLTKLLNYAKEKNYPHCEILAKNLKIMHQLAKKLPTELSLEIIKFDTAAEEVKALIIESRPICGSDCRCM